MPHIWISKSKENIDGLKHVQLLYSGVICVTFCSMGREMCGIYCSIEDILFSEVFLVFEMGNI
jgi:hypothetical protein